MTPTKTTASQARDLAHSTLQYCTPMELKAVNGWLEKGQSGTALVLLLLLADKYGTR